MFENNIVRFMMLLLLSKISYMFLKSFFYINRRFSIKSKQSHNMSKEIIDFEKSLSASFNCIFLTYFSLTKA